MPRGGRRAGAGPKRGVKRGPQRKTLEKAAAREALRVLLMGQQADVAQALVSRACGVRYFVTRNKKTGKYELVTSADRVVKALNREGDESGEFYTGIPDVGAIKEFNDRTVDKATEHVEAIVSGAEALIARLTGARNRL